MGTGLEKDAKKNLAECFRLLDTNRDGKVDLKEILIEDMIEEEIPQNVNSTLCSFRMRLRPHLTYLQDAFSTLEQRTKSRYLSEFSAWMNGCVFAFPILREIAELSKRRSSRVGHTGSAQPPRQHRTARIERPTTRSKALGWRGATPFVRCSG